MAGKTTPSYLDAHSSVDRARKVEYTLKINETIAVLMSLFLNSNQVMLS